MKKKKIILIDGNSLVYRAFFALPTSLVNSKGRITNAVYGFTSMLIKLIKDERPDIVIAAFDKGKATFRHEEFEDYKAHRQPTPNELISQFPLVKELLGALNIPVFEMAGFEADDILATLASRAEATDNDVIVVTGDRDAFQLVDEHVRIMTTRKGISDIVLYDRQKVEEKYGVTPEQVTDYLALKGDASDNIPGVPGFGEKTASKLIQQFGTLENLIENIDSIENKRWRGMLEEHIDEAILSKRLATLDRDVPIDIDYSECRFGDWDDEKIREVFTELEFPSLLERLLGKTDKKNDSVLGEEPSSHREKPETFDVLQITDEDILSELAADIDGTGCFSLSAATIGEGVDRQISGIGVAMEIAIDTGKIEKKKRVYYFFEPHQMTLDFNDSAETDRAFNMSTIMNRLKPYLESSKFMKLGHDTKRLILTLENSDVHPYEFEFDTMIAAYLIEPEGSGYPIDILTKANIGMSMPDADANDRLAYEAIAVLRLSEKQKEVLQSDGLFRIFQEVEMPLVPILAGMEREGVSIDIDYLFDLSKELELMLGNIENEIYSLTEQEFNINSPQQLGFILFEKLGLPKSRKTKTGYSTDANVLAKLITVHPVVEKVISYRELAKLKSTYVDALPKLINYKTGKLHTSFNQTVTTTGRLSSSNPNLQNIPVRTDLGQRIRKAFVPSDPDEVFLSADYSQIELRLLAQYSNEEVLIKAFQEDRDIHEATAVEVFGILPEQVTPQMRRIAKMVNFGVLYGMSAYGLSDRLGIPVSDAKSFIERYFSRLPKVEMFIDKTITEAREKGYVETLMGRRRYIPELKSTNRQVRSLGERFAVNAPLQGTAADIIKLAMISVNNELKGQALKSRMILQVHDELIFVVPYSEQLICANIVKDAMENAYPLQIKLKVVISEGNNWKDAK